MKTFRTRLTKVLPLLLTAFLVLTPAALAAESADEDESMISEMMLGLKVKSSLLTKLGWAATVIDVDVEGDRVMLSGEVEERSTQEMAKEIAAAVEGVGSVSNDIELKPSDDGTPVANAVENAELEVKDAVLETRVKTELLSELGRHGFGIEVEATGGVVSLEGTVPDSERHERAIEVTEKCEGVDKVIDLLKLERRS